jgi:hypothetical protein
MELQLQEVSKLSIKEQKERATGISKAIREQLAKIPEGKATPLETLALYVTENFPSVPDKQQAYVRINHVLKSLPAYKRFTSDDNKTWIGK